MYFYLKKSSFVMLVKKIMLFSKLAEVVLRVKKLYPVNIHKNCILHERKSEIYQ